MLKPRDPSTLTFVVTVNVGEHEGSDVHLASVIDRKRKHPRDNGRR